MPGVVKIMSKTKINKNFRSPLNLWASTVWAGKAYFKVNAFLFRGTC